MALDATGASSGLAILWHPSMILLNQFFATRHSLSVVFQLVGSDQIGTISNLYGPQLPQDKLAFLNSLCTLAPITSQNPWRFQYNSYTLKETRD